MAEDAQAHAVRRRYRPQSSRRCGQGMANRAVREEHMSESFLVAKRTMWRDDVSAVAACVAQLAHDFHELRLCCFDSGEAVFDFAVNRP